MDTFGVCMCNDIKRYEPEVRNLIRFNTYEEAFKYYIDKAFSENSLNPDRNLWIVYINDKDVVIQFDQLEWASKTKCVRI